MSDNHSMSIADAVLEPQSDLARLGSRALIVGAVGAAATVAGYFVAPTHFYRAYLVAMLLVFHVAAGLFGLGMLNHVTGGRWGALARRVFEASGRTLWVFIFLALPILFSMSELFPWADLEFVKGDSLVAYKASWWLNMNRFVAVQLGYVVGLTLLAFTLSRMSHRHDETGDERTAVNMQRLSSIGLIFFVLLGTFAAVDWVMSLDPHWFSSLFGFGWVAGQGLSAWAFLVPLMVFLSGRKPHRDLVTPRLFHDYGKLMLAFVMLWTYLTLSQFLIIWSGDLPEEVPWYLVRSTHGWQTVSGLLMLAHFALPFLILLSADLKKQPRRLMWVGIWLLGARWLDLFWQVTPSVMHWQEIQGVITEGHATLHWLDIATVLAIGGFWLFLLTWQLRRRAMVPVQDPVIKEAMAHG